MHMELNNDFTRTRKPIEFLEAVNGPLSGSILRGGSWYDPPRFCRSAMRRWLDEDRGGPDIGFRVALVPAEPDSPQNGEAQR